MIGGSQGFPRVGPHVECAFFENSLAARLPNGQENDRFGLLNGDGLKAAQPYPAGGSSSSRPQF